MPFWSLQLTTKTTKLRILLDENLPADLSESIKRHSSAFLVIEDIQSNRPGMEDGPMMKYAKEKELIVITMDNGINQRTHPPCQHPGVIRLAARKKHKNAAAFRKFLLSGIRKHVHHCVTFVSYGKARVIGHEGEHVYQF